MNEPRRAELMQMDEDDRTVRAEARQYKRAPTAWNMIARGKREARRPWYQNKELIPALKGRNTFCISAF